MRLHRLGHAHHLRRCGHLHIQVRGYGPAEHFDIAVLNVSPVATQMDCNSLRPGQLAQHRGGNRIRLVALAHLADGGDVIDVHGKTHDNRVNDEP